MDLLKLVGIGNTVLKAVTGKKLFEDSGKTSWKAFFASHSLLLSVGSIVFGLVCIIKPEIAIKLFEIVGAEQFTEA